MADSILATIRKYNGVALEYNSVFCGIYDDIIIVFKGKQCIILS